MANMKGKLVRDRIPDIIRQDGDTPSVRTLREGEYRRALLEKLGEEAAEVKKAHGKRALVKELADVEEVLRALRHAFGITRATVSEKQVERRRKRGGFTKRLFLTSIK